MNELPLQTSDEKVSTSRTVASQTIKIHDHFDDV